MIRRKIVFPKKKEEKIDPKNKICLKCKFAYLMRSNTYNPIVSECAKTKERHVASAPHNEDCGFKENKEEVVIHEMNYLR